MKNKMTIEEFKQYVILEAKKLFKIEVLKEEKNKIEKQLSLLSECVPPAQIGHDYLAGAPLMSPETLAKTRAEMLKKAAGWDFSKPKQLDEKRVSEINKSAMMTAKKDIEASGKKFEPLGKNKFEKNINKKELHKAMSPEKTNESAPSTGLSNKKKSAVVKKQKQKKNIEAKKLAKE